MKGFQITGQPGSPVIVSVPHTGTRVPPEIVRQLAVPVSMVRKRIDAFAWDLAETAAPVARIIRALYARAVVDLNRSGTLTDVDLSHAPERDHERLVRLFGSGGELLWRARLGEEPLGHQELRRRIAHYHDPYHEALQKLLKTAPRPCALVDMHSMDETAFDLVVGDFRGRSAGVELCEGMICPFFAERGYRAGYAGPRQLDRRGRPLSEVAIRHSGGFITSRYGDPEAGCHAVQIEASRATAKARLQEMRRDFGAFFVALRDWLLTQRQA